MLEVIRESSVQVHLHDSGLIHIVRSLRSRMLCEAELGWVFLIAQQQQSQQ